MAVGHEERWLVAVCVAGRRWDRDPAGAAERVADRGGGGDAVVPVAAVVADLLVAELVEAVAALVATKSISMRSPAVMAARVAELAARPRWPSQRLLSSTWRWSTPTTSMPSWPRWRP